MMIDPRKAIYFEERESWFKVWLMWFAEVLIGALIGAGFMYAMMGGALP